MLKTKEVSNSSLSHRSGEIISKHMKMLSNNLNKKEQSKTSYKVNLLSSNSFSTSINQLLN